MGSMRHTAVNNINEFEMRVQDGMDKDQRPSARYPLVPSAHAYLAQDFAKSSTYGTSRSLTGPFFGTTYTT